MQATYELRVMCRCPVDHKANIYDVAVRSHTTILVEILKQETLAVAAKEMFQEDMTDFLARELLSEVTSVGWHNGVKVTVVSQGCKKL